MKKIIVILALSLTLTACASSNAAFDNGPTPLAPLDHRTAVSAYVKDVLKDPDSLRDFEIAQQPKYKLAYMKKRWMVCFFMNAKNSFGGYTGKTMHVAIFEGDTVIGTEKDEDFVRDRCADAGPFIPA